MDDGGEEGDEGEVRAVLIGPEEFLWSPSIPGWLDRGEVAEFPGQSDGKEEEEEEDGHGEGECCRPPRQPLGQSSEEDSVEDER